MITVASLLIFIGMSVDSFVISLGKGLATKEMTWKKATIVGLWFGIFHGLMPLVGFLIGASVSDLIVKYNRWVLFGIFLLLGGMMIKDAFFDEEEGPHTISGDIGVKSMLPLAIAVSLDALIVGVTFSTGTISLVEGDLALAVANFVAGFLGMYIGYNFGTKFGKIAVVVGGVLLIINAFLALFDVV